MGQKYALATQRVEGDEEYRGDEGTGYRGDEWYR